MVKLLSVYIPVELISREVTRMIHSELEMAHPVCVHACPAFDSLSMFPSIYCLAMFIVTRCMYFSSGSPDNFVIYFR